MQTIRVSKIHNDSASKDTHSLPNAHCPHRSGVHNITFNPSRTLMVTGGENPNDPLLYSVPDFRPLKNYLVSVYLCVYSGTCVHVCTCVCVSELSTACLAFVL